jgi:hypothetical protein
MSKSVVLAMTIDISLPDGSFNSQLSFPVSSTKEEIDKMVKSFCELALVVIEKHKDKEDE